MNGKAADLRRHILAAVEKFPHDSALLLSGGVDSATILAAALALGRRPTCYTFHLDGIVSRDAVTARSMCEALGVPWRRVVIRRDVTELEADVRRLVAAGVRPIKTHVQCAQPFIHLGEAVAADGYRHAMKGMAATALWPTTRHSSIAMHKGVDEWNSFRRREMESYLRPLDSGVSLQACNRAAALSGVTLLDPYMDADLFAFVTTLTPDDLYKPRQKALLVDAFPELWERGNWYRTNSNLQINSCVREWHDALLGTPLNVRGWKSPVGIYGAIARGEI